MNGNQIYRLDAVSVLDIDGADAATIAHNLTTNEVTGLSPDSGCESFVTDVRGKTLGHVLVFGQPAGLRLIGSAGQSSRLSEHFDRYTIREDSVPVIRDTDFVAVVLAPDAAAKLPLQWPETDHLSSTAMDEIAATAYQAPWLGQGTLILLLAKDRSATIDSWCQEHSLELGEEWAFHRHRIAVGFPWYGTDIDDSNLPQEAQRDAGAISFTKGCYLGQETVARLDAMGQVQKKLVRWSIDGAVPAAGTTLTSNEKTVGRLTSVAPSDDHDAIALGMARRSHFDPGSSASGTDQETGQEFVGRVME